MTLNHKNTPNCRLIALAWARIKAEGEGKEVEVSETEYQENPHPGPRMAGLYGDAGHRGRV